MYNNSFSAERRDLISKFVIKFEKYTSEEKRRQSFAYTNTLANIEYIIYIMQKTNSCECNKRISSSATNKNKTQKVPTRISFR